MPRDLTSIGLVAQQWLPEQRRQQIVQKCGAWFSLEDRIRLLRRWFSARGVNPMRRREFIRLFSSPVVAWSLTARAQQSAMPVVGFMISGIQARSQQIAAFHAGLKDTGYVQGQNVTVELRSAEDHFD